MGKSMEIGLESGRERFLLFASYTYVDVGLFTKVNRKNV